MRPNRGWFKKGDDSRRHPLTTDERQRGGKTAFAQLWKTHPRLARWLLEHKIKPPIDRAQRNAALLAWVEARQRQAPDDMPYEQSQH
jgi:hypothetical protein